MEIWKSEMQLVFLLLNSEWLTFFPPTEKLKSKTLKNLYLKNEE